MQLKQKHSLQFDEKEWDIFCSFHIFLPPHKTQIFGGRVFLTAFKIFWKLLIQHRELLFLGNSTTQLWYGSIHYFLGGDGEDSTSMLKQVIYDRVEKLGKRQFQHLKRSLCPNLLTLIRGMVTVGGFASAIKLWDVPLSTSCIVQGMNCLPFKPNKKSYLRASINMMTAFLKRGFGVLVQLEDRPKKQRKHKRNNPKQTFGFQLQELPQFSGTLQTLVKSAESSTIFKSNQEFNPSKQNQGAISRDQKQQSFAGAETVAVFSSEQLKHATGRS